MNILVPRIVPDKVHKVLSMFPQHWLQNPIGYDLNQKKDGWAQVQIKHSRPK